MVIPSKRHKHGAILLAANCDHGPIAASRYRITE